MKKISVGLDVSTVRDLPSCLDEAISKGFEFVTIPMFHPRLKRDCRGISAARTGPGARSDLVMGSERWTSSVVGKLSPWLELDSEIPSTRLASEAAFKQEVALASHLAVPAILTPPLSCGFDVTNLAMHINQVVQASPTIHFWVGVPLVFPGGGDGAGNSSSSPSSSMSSTAPTSLPSDYPATLPTPFEIIEMARSPRELPSEKSSKLSPPHSASSHSAANSSATSSSTFDIVQAGLLHISSATCLTTDKFTPSAASAPSQASTPSSPVNGSAGIGATSGTGIGATSGAGIERGGGGEGRLPEPPLLPRSRRDPWEAWNLLRCLAGGHPHIHVALEIDERLPHPLTIEKWLGEPVKAAVFKTSAFLLNKKGYPTLPLAHRDLLRSLHAHGVQIVLKGRPKTGLVVSASPPPSSLMYHSSNSGSGGGGSGSSSSSVPPTPDAWKPYHQYIDHVINGEGGSGSSSSSSSSGRGGQTDSDARGEAERFSFESPYFDFLQAPLQPLADNLESATYEVFERDPVKYSQYYEAARQALADQPAERKVIVVMVVGAGRGPLVQRVLRAADDVGREVRVYAVEKNANAIITLRNLKKTEWKERVTIISSDMRSWEPPEKADILVSELLGSFGDNELSPECLDGAQRLLKEGGISIPSSYTSFLAPMTSSKLWNDVKAYKEHKWFETAYVARMFNFKAVSPPQATFTFVHPNRATKIDNRRAATLRFISEGSALIHGLAGYFDATLYKDVHISINPETHSPGMFSWFPLFFPITEPIYVASGETIEVRMWRCVGPTKVWFEWAFTSPTVSPIHNPTGRSYYIGL